MPDNAMSVLDFIGLELSKTTSAILTYSAKAWVSKESPTEDAKARARTKLAVIRPRLCIIWQIDISKAIYSFCYQGSGI